MTDSRPARAAALAVVFLGFVFGLFELFDLDFGLARATGRWILDHHAVPHENVMSEVNAHHAWVDDKWLFHVLAAVVVEKLPPALGVILRALLVAFLALLLTRPPRGEEQTPERRILAAAIAVVALVASNERFWFRPELFTLLFLASFARTLCAVSAVGAKDIVALVMLQAFWVNLHGYFVLGPIVATLSLVGRLVDGALTRRPANDLAPRFLLVPLLVAACLLNPYGVDLLWSPVELVKDLREHIALYSAAIVEFVPTFSRALPDPLPSDLIAYRVLLGIGGAALVVGLARRRVRLQELVPLAALVVMSLEVRRNVSLFAVALPPIAARWLSPGRWPQLLGGAASAAVIVVSLALAALVGTDRVAVHDRLDRRFGVSAFGAAHPVEEVEFVRSELPKGVLFNSFSFGSFFTGQCFPERAAFIDGNTAGYPTSFLQEYVDFVTGKTATDAFIAKFGITQFLVKPGNPVTDRLLADDRFVPVFLGRHALVLVKRGPEHDEVIRKFDLRAAAKAGKFVAAVSSEPSSIRAVLPTAEWNRARFFSGVGRADLAEAALRETLAILPGLAQARVDLGIALRAEGKLPDAKAELSRACSELPRDPQAALFLAFVLADLRDLPGARREAERALEIDPEFVPAHRFLAGLLRAIGSASDAELHQREADRIEAEGR